ncbi:uncharacterized protein LOC129566088 [Sitodiplosis mosellana]|uniref:uncharacterized protein LOC129566088 n=1 Tax=Sitodiplosis mosellana TaxID=263140 RepID=UPI002443CD9F|nr:uncharacterized protein LOC129566088 [Sitodiplosis mosellana]
MCGYYFAKYLQIILGSLCVYINYRCFLQLQSISSGWELMFHIITAAFLISTTILLLTMRRVNSGKSDERIHDSFAAICLFVASICLLITINGDKENVLNKDIGEQSYFEQKLQKFGKYFNKVAGPSPVDTFTNKYKRNSVYDAYTLAGLTGLVNALLYLCSSSLKPKSNNQDQVVIMTDLSPKQAFI